MKRRVKHAVAVLVVLSTLLLSSPVFADAGGGPGSNHGCPGHQPPPPPSRNCGN